MSSIIPNKDEQLLLKKISFGDPGAFRSLFDRYRKLVYTCAFKILKSNEDAEEILQDVFLKIWNHDDISNIKNIEYYLRTITRNLSISLWRKKQLEYSINMENAQDWKEYHNQTEETIIYNETSQVIRKAIELLPPQQKVVYNLCRVEGLKYIQVAELLLISPLTVKTHMQHALRFLRKYMKEHGSIAILALLIHLLNSKK